MDRASRRQVGTWLLVGVFMIVIQTMLGGITRLTESGLSITEWDVVSGTLPPLNAHDWQVEFNKYKQSSQYHLLNEGMQLSDFKNIFWWEYTHRLWARLFLPVFLIPLLYFIIRKKIDRSTVVKSLIALVLGALQGVVGWIMVASGLKDRAWVGPVELTSHFMLAMILLGYLLWIALETFDPPREGAQVRGFSRMITVIAVALFVQLSFGGLMAGNHAALFYPTFPSFNGRWLPPELFTLTPFINNFFLNVGLIQVIHRSLGFIVLILVFIFYLKARKLEHEGLFFKAARWMPSLVFFQVLLGIVTLLNSLGHIPVSFGVLHQLCAVLLMLATLTTLFATVQAEKAAGE